jgi:endogenous inhibitor of DNA gyrase (YacG/DUF329 family)
MIVYQLATPRSNSTIRPNCPECQTRMRLFGIEYEAPEHELYSYECPKCQRIETAVAQMLQ